MSREDLVLLVIWLVALVCVFMCLFMCICLRPRNRDVKKSRDIESGAASSTSLPETRAGIIAPPVTTFQEDQTNESQNLCSICKKQFSSGQLANDGYTTVFHGDNWKISKGAMTIARGRKSGTLYKTEGACHLIAVAMNENPNLWHRRLGHMKIPVIETPQSEDSCENNDNEELDAPELSIPAPVLRRSSRPHVPNRKYLNYILLTDEGEPENYEEACQMTDATLVDETCSCKDSRVAFRKIVNLQDFY
ncbi:hypothetical protein V8G54_032117 [Vigna mungo]|uniref:GAG-pre-integrase domain-containing protein n=1 Tax=Vigna mungo TaxID=3915 RepID=A0AAQ3MMC2_VIGMU